jgi:hypothetical protein
VRDGKPYHWTLWGYLLLIVHFDDNNKLVTSDNEIYTPKGNVRLNFVDHGENFANGENGMAELTDRVKQIYDTYANENTYFDRIMLLRYLLKSFFSA